ncbi:MAG: 4Fe-4S binding protein, partial [Candidatus Omnitrophica bacterium]|nr:4Fe-4S binding protein [Candidatus Omnitrophota bacterium]
APLSSFIFRMQNSGMFSKALRNLASQLNIIPVINHSLCRKCMECYNICPAKAISKDLKIDRKKCINCLCCFEVCPHRAITVRKSFLARMILP